MNWLDLNAKQAYFDLIDSGFVPEVKVHKKTGVCYDYNSLIGGHVHHITPRSEGGTDDPSNLVDLSYQDHLKAHYLLSKGIKTSEARQAYRCMIDFQGDWGEEPELTDEMAEEYAIARAKCREIQSDLMSKPVACVKGHFHPETLKIFKSQTKCAEEMGFTKTGLVMHLKRGRQLISEGKPPRKMRSGLIFVDADSEWIQSYMEIGVSPHLDLSKNNFLKKFSDNWRRAA